MLIKSASEIRAVDLLTHDATNLVSGLEDSRGLAIDIREKKLYFGDGNGSLSQANLDGSGKEVILKKAFVGKLAVDWIGRRIFWTKRRREMRIFVVKMDGKHERTLTNTQALPYGIAVDPNVG